VTHCKKHAAGTLSKVQRTYKWVFGLKINLFFVQPYFVYNELQRKIIGFHAAFRRDKW